ncbi:hypothetical protein NLJ89_g5436 [Agrocybe chaxingu]|uniref:LysM domain-containing protein n=1 Tax=Agrocybe chaxingu TaxID=84603 RepID=A0A9W8K111_9AGAR|nr:hypothetical protein NLJ89_g5436 [Agrocybe chaxingu]
MSHDAADDLSYNPFAEDDSPRADSNLAQGYYSSAFFPKLGSSSPTLRRRRSSLTDKPSMKPKESRRKHIRSHTEIEISPHSAGPHPLKSALLGTIGAVFLENPDVTRPHLSRLVNDATAGDRDDVEDDESQRTALPADEEKEVIVHKVRPLMPFYPVKSYDALQVTAKDSLAGVSLKYGISMANLRRANQLWTSDTVHRKEVLYIPIDQATRAREFIPEPLISLTPEPTTDSTNIFEDAYTSTLLVNGDRAQSLPPSPTVPIVRVPSRQLSYFPPSTNKNPDVKHHGHTDADSLHLQPSPTKTSPGTGRYNPSQPNSSLSSILTALPIAASTRDEIITRLSLDSVSSSFTDRSRANSDEETGHEMDDVAKRKRHSRHENGVAGDLDELSMPTPKVSDRRPSSRIPTQGVQTGTVSSSLPKHSHARSLSSTSPPRFYVSQASETVIRTSQLEPSPAMQIPNFRSQTLGRSSAKGQQDNLIGNRPQLLGVAATKTTKPERRKEGEIGLMLEQLQVNGLG